MGLDVTLFHSVNLEMKYIEIIIYLYNFKSYLIIHSLCFSKRFIFLPQIKTIVVTSTSEIYTAPQTM